MRPPALLALLGLISLLMLPNGIEGGALVHLFHYHKTGHDLILSVMGSLVRGEMVSPTAPLVAALSAACARVATGGRDDSGAQRS
jgi:hypothetical protein